MPTAYITAPRSAAADIAENLVEDQLAACVNVVECESTYRWDDDVHHDSESILLAKTSDARYAALVKRVESVHPHDVPCIERFDEEHVLPQFEKWRDGAVG